MKLLQRFRRITDRTWLGLGWLLFIVSSLFYLVSSWRSGDWFAVLGSLAFLLANISFVIPFLRTRE